MDKRFIIWDSNDGNPRRENGEFISSGLLGQITEDNVYLRVYAKWPTQQRPAELEVGQSILNVEFNLSGSRGVYDVYRVR